MTEFLVTHTAPDLDAICAAWLLLKVAPQAAGLPAANVPIRFVNTGQPDPELLRQARAVVDTGRAYDPTQLRFDHHHFTGAAATQTCAARQVFEFLQACGAGIDYLYPLVELVWQGDTGQAAAAYSRQLGLHALLQAYTGLDDQKVAFGFDLLDLIATNLRQEAAAERELAEKVVYRSNDGLLWAIQGGSRQSTQAAFARGARMVVFEGAPSETPDGTTYPVGILRHGEYQEPDVGALVQAVLAAAPANAALRPELQMWFCHPAGFFAGRGTPKAPVHKPLQGQLRALARAIDLVRLGEKGRMQ